MNRKWLGTILLCTAAAAQTLPNPAGATASAGSAIRLMQDRRYAEAAAEFEKALAANPADDALRIAYATCLFAQERNAESRAQFEIERKRLGDQPGIMYYLGQLDLRANDFRSVIAKLEPLAGNPAFRKAAFYAGLAYLSDGQQKKALALLEQAARNEPDDAEVHYRLGRVYMIEGRAEEAEREFQVYRGIREIQRVVEQDGQSCMNALRESTIERARAVCNHIADPKDARRMLLLGQLYAGAHAFSDAVEPLRQAVALDPEAFDGWHNLGLSLYWTHRYREALPALRKAAALNPRYFDTLNLLAATLHALGDDRAALPVLERAHDLNPGDRAVSQALERMRAAAGR